MSKKVKIGVVGTGYTVGIAKPHVKAYQSNKDVEMIALYDIVPGRAAEWADKNGFKDADICNTYEELLEKVDAVSICTPNSTHADLSIKALEAGKHVLCEKPLAHTIEAAVKMVECARKHPELVNMIGFNYRGIPAVRYIKYLIDNGEMGKIFGCRHCLGGQRIANPIDVKLEWRMQEELSGLGALADFGSHMLDLTDYLLRDTAGEIKELTALLTTSILERTIIGSEQKGAVTNDDTAAFIVKMESGAVSTFYASRIGVRGHIWEIIGEGGIFIYEGQDRKLKIQWKDKNGSYHKEVEEIDVPEEFIVETRFHHEIDEFIENILNNKQSQRNFERGLYIQKILEALKDSALSGKTIKL